MLPVQQFPDVTLDQLIPGLARQKAAQAMQKEDSDIGLNKAHAEYFQQRANPIMENMPELFKAELLYKKMKDTYGDDHPYTQEAFNNYRLMQQHSQTNSDWHDQLARSMNFRSMTPAMKDISGQMQAEGGFTPSPVNNVPTGMVAPDATSQTYSNPPQSQNTLGNIMNLPFGQSFSNQQQSNDSLGDTRTNQGPITNQVNGVQLTGPENRTLHNLQTGNGQIQASQPSPQLNPRAQSNLGMLQNKTIKDTGQSDNLKRINFGNQAEVTIGNMLQYLPSVKKYTGIGGEAKLLKDRVATGLGAEIPEYQDYLNFKSLGSQATEQLTQYWAGSIQPEAKEQLNKIIDPTSWDRSPKDVESVFNTSRRNLHQELDVRKKAVESSSGYKVNKQDKTLGDVLQKKEPTQESSDDTITVMDTNGKTHVIYRSNLGKATKRSPGLKVVG